MQTADEAGVRCSPGLDCRILVSPNSTAFLCAPSTSRHATVPHSSTIQPRAWQHWRYTCRRQATSRQEWLPRYSNPLSRMWLIY